MLGTPENKPPFLSDKQLEPALKFLNRKFPQIDTKTNAVSIINIMILLNGFYFVLL